MLDGWLINARVIGSVRIETWDKQLRCIFNVAVRTL